MPEPCAGQSASPQQRQLISPSCDRGDPNHPHMKIGQPWTERAHMQAYAVASPLLDPRGGQGLEGVQVSAWPSGRLSRLPALRGDMQL